MADRSKRLPRSPLGRLIILGIFWSAAAFICIAVLGSMVRELYGPPPQTLQEPRAVTALGHRGRTWCVGRIVGLKNQLDRRIADELRRPHGATGKGVTAWRAWNDQWLAELDDAQRRCTSSGDQALVDAYGQLRNLRDAYAQAIGILRHARTEGVAKLRTSLEELRNLPVQ